MIKWNSDVKTNFENVDIQVLPYLQEVQFSGGVKKYSPYVYPPIFRGEPGVARCIMRVTGVSFFSNKQKNIRCIQRKNRKGVPKLVKVDFFSEKLRKINKAG